MNPEPEIRVVHVIEAMFQGGSEQVVVEHVRHADPRVQAAVCTINGGGPAFEAARAAGAPTFDLSDTRRSRHAMRLARIPRLARLFRDMRADVVNAHNPTGAIYGVLAARLARVPVVIRTEHSIHDPARHSRLYLALEPALTMAVSRVVCVCEAVRDSHTCRLPRWADRFVSIPNGVSDAQAARPRDEVRAALGIGADERVVLTVGSLTPQKAQHVLIEAFATVATRRPEARLWVVGDGPLGERLASQAAALGLGERVRFLAARDDVPDLMHAADLFALSSGREGLPITILEAMRAGLPVIATTIGGCGEAVSDGETGLLVPPEDAAALAARLERLLADPQTATRMGEAGRLRWAQRFGAERMVWETEAMYREVLARARGGGR